MWPIKFTGVHLSHDTRRYRWTLVNSAGHVLTLLGTRGDIPAGYCYTRRVPL